MLIILFFKVLKQVEFSIHILTIAANFFQRRRGVSLAVFTSDFLSDGCPPISDPSILSVRSHELGSPCAVTSAAFGVRDVVFELVVCEKSSCVVLSVPRCLRVLALLGLLPPPLSSR